MEAHTEKAWRDTYRRLTELDRMWEKPRFRAAALKDLHRFMTERCADVPHLGPLVRLVRPEMTRRDLFALLVPCERELKRVKITDTEILSADLPAGVTPAGKMPLTVVADNFRSAVNVGTLFRVCDCFGVRDAVLCGYTPSPDDGRAKASALGSENWVPWTRFDRTLSAVHALREKGLRTVALETVEGASPLEDWEWPFPCAVFLGSERFGLDADVVEACDACVRIPVFGRKNSLNVVTAFSIVAYKARMAFERMKGTL